MNGKYGWNIEILGKFPEIETEKEEKKKLTKKEERRKILMEYFEEQFNNYIQLLNTQMDEDVKKGKTYSSLNLESEDARWVRVNNSINELIPKFGDLFSEKLNNFFKEQGYDESDLKQERIYHTKY